MSPTLQANHEGGFDEAGQDFDVACLLGGKSLLHHNPIIRSNP
uniref:Uncharacterized protein n=1 Tax=Anguilla anguilla TaxID=7936 RepID=A0A0E9TGL6_ANGAN